MSFLSRDLQVVYFGVNNLHHCWLKHFWSCYRIQTGYRPRICGLYLFFISGKLYF